MIIWNTNETITGTNTLIHSGQRFIAMTGYSTFPKGPELESHH